jgi:glycine/D-amino acid oxidase-like deaminating enzyme
LEPIGIDPVVNPKKRRIFVIRASISDLSSLLHMKGYNDLYVMPFTILPRRIYVKPEIREESFWVGLSDDLGGPYALEEDPKPEENFYKYSIYPVLSKYLPQFTGASPASMWAGHYDMNPIDGQPVIFKIGNIEVAAGTSGSGITKADAIGRIASAVALDIDEAELFDGTSLSEIYGACQGYHNISILQHNRIGI